MTFFPPFNILVGRLKLSWEVIPKIELEISYQVVIVLRYRQSNINLTNKAEILQTIVETKK